MTEYDACEQAYKHGYEDGYNQAICDACMYLSLHFNASSAYNKYVHTLPNWQNFRELVDNLPGN